VSSPSDDDERPEPGLDPLLVEMRAGFAEVLAGLDRLLALQQQTITLLTDAFRGLRGSGRRCVYAR
jgi:hypothetical protein